ncbi:hypothetical protein LTV02_03995 [Nocardia yamanashiensis]|uniref:hypothetical protein n=1 Tax=Nocardia yamanashiensis TaxID=209247 RepID=UPI001E390BD5|nr:hypothetical protein [Nocardia yamanashiensis]UGT42592.1 hypothetical protein LTV02_03995 [Nocardia yamanashiensis]
MRTTVRGGAVEMVVAADAEMLPVLRSMVEMALLTADFALPEVIDVRVAVDEVATALLVSAAADAEVTCALRYDEFRVEVRMSALTRTRGVLWGDGLSRVLLESLTDELEFGEDGRVGDRRGHGTVVRFGRNRIRHGG